MGGGDEWGLGKNGGGEVSQRQSIECGGFIGVGGGGVDGWLAGRAGRAWPANNWMSTVFQSHTNEVGLPFNFGGGGVAGWLAGRAGRARPAQK